MNWQSLSTTEEAINLSQKHPIILFKHSTRCPVSATVKSTFEDDWENKLEDHTSVFYIDVIGKRNLSNEIAQILEVEHQSPQLLIIYKKKCIFHSSHFSINYSDVKREVHKYI